MGLASWLVWRQGGLRTQALPLCLYILQLGVNLFAWPPIFVGGQRRRYAVADSAGQKPSDAPPAPPVCKSAICAVTPLHPGAAAHLLQSHTASFKLVTCLHTALLGVSLMTMGRFYVASPAAGFLMLPYLGWTCFATTLINCSLWDSNPAVVQSAHKFAQVRPQSPADMAPAKSGHIRNNTAPGDLGRIDTRPPTSDNGGVHYSDRPILGQLGAQGQLGGWSNAADVTQQQQQQQSWQQHEPWSQSVSGAAQPVSSTPFADAGLHRRSATDTDRRTTRRTTDDFSDRLMTHTDSGHLIIPQQWDKPERKNSSGLFGKVRRGCFVIVLQSSYLY